ncbi:MAG: cyclic pyranopterin monophosphate synthase MoaC, partial [Planctomycetota bacterium]
MAAGGEGGHDPELCEPALTHLRPDGSAHMVDVGAKPVTVREARAEARVVMRPETLEQVLAGGLPKGDVAAVARVAGILGAKRTPQLVPLCHPLPLEAVEIEIEPEPPRALRCVCRCRTTARTGVEMEALTGALVAALTVYDMIKGIDRGAEIAAAR